MVKKVALLTSIIVVLLAAAGLAWRSWDTEESSSVTNFYECESAGYAIGESHPRQCFGPDGQTFIEPLNESSSKDAMFVVHFSKTPESTTEFDYTVAVNRESSTGGSALEQALIELVKGPTDSEIEAGIFNPLKLSGDSTCNSADFELTEAEEKITVAFCRQIESAGIGDDARIKAVITETIAANSSTAPPKVIILDQSGNCFGDLSGQNICLN